VCGQSRLLSDGGDPRDVPALVAGFGDKDGVIIDAKSGVTGAGKKMLRNIFPST
jgi:hypothetical protein